MWLKLASATFTTNLGTMSSLSNSISIRYTASGFSPVTGSVSKDAASASLVLNLLSNWTCDSTPTVSVTGANKGSISYSAGKLTIPITPSSGSTFGASGVSSINISVTGAVANTPDSGGTPETPPSGGETTTTLPLVQGYIDKGMVNNDLSTRVRSDGLASGPFSVEVNSGYLIRAIYEHTKQDLSDGGTAIVASADAKTSYSGGTAGKYYAFTFCKSDASQSLSPTENIIKSFSGTIVPITAASSGGDSGSTTNPEAGTDVPYTLVQGAHVQNDSSLYNGTNRVTTPKAIKGKFTVTVNDGYVIRAVYEYTKESGDTAGVMVSETSTTKTTFTSTNANKYYGVTFTKASDNANDTIAPTENIVKSWKYV